jgi:hypothetical protein
VPAGDSTGVTGAISLGVRNPASGPAYESLGLLWAFTGWREGTGPEVPQSVSHLPHMEPTGVPAGTTFVPRYGQGWCAGILGRWWLRPVPDSGDGCAGFMRLLVFLLRPAHDDLECIIWQWPLERLGLIPRHAHPNVALLVGR